MHTPRILNNPYIKDKLTVNCYSYLFQVTNSFAYNSCQFISHHPLHIFVFTESLYIEASTAALRFAFDSLAFVLPSPISSCHSVVLDIL